jgi:hypothetical protein
MLQPNKKRINGALKRQLVIPKFFQIEIGLGGRLSVADLLGM